MRFWNKDWVSYTARDSKICPKQSLESRAAYLALRMLFFPFAFCSFRFLRKIGRIFGILCYYLMHTYRKRTFSNLALAKDLHLSPSQIRHIAKASFQNLAITCLEYPKLQRAKPLPNSISCKNPEKATKLYSQGKGIVFFSAHQANWETLFLEGTSRMRGLAVGKPTNNPYLYQWVRSIREQFGGTIVEPRQAIGKGLKALRQGIFVGLVADQATPEMGLLAPFLGRNAWTSTAPALLAYKTNGPLFFAETKRTESGYDLFYHGPYFPDLTKPMEEEAKRLTLQMLSLLEKSIRDRPDEWLWQHNRWKQQTPKILKKPYRLDAICLILSKETFLQIQLHLKTFRELYPKELLSLMVPKSVEDPSFELFDEVHFYQELKEILQEDLRYKLIFNFTENPQIRSHYLKLSAFEVLSLKEIQKKEVDFSTSLKHFLRRE